MESQPWDYYGIQGPIDSKLRKIVLQLHSTEYKRQVLARIESIFDPLGLVSPTVISHKTFPQKPGHDNSLWDEQRHPHCGGMVKNGLRSFFKPQQTPPSNRLLQTIAYNRRQPLATGNSQLLPRKN
jgi:hypothetical protein